MSLPRFSIGTGDRFGREGEAQLAALEWARARGVEVGIVWNKSAREHAIIGSTPADQRETAAAAVASSGWKGPWYVDADHVGLSTVEAFAPYCDFFTIDVADSIGQPSTPDEIEAFFGRHHGLPDSPGLPAPVDEGIPVSTIAPKFPGRFDKGVDYSGDVGAFLAEFEADVAVASWAPGALGEHRESVSRNVTLNLRERHLAPLLFG